MPRPHPLAGQEVHRRHAGRQVRRGSHPRRREDVGGEHESNTHGLSAVHGLRPHQQHRGTGQEVQIRYGLVIMECVRLD